MAQDGLAELVDGVPKISAAEFAKRPVLNEDAPVNWANPPRSSVLVVLVVAASASGTVSVESAKEANPLVFGTGEEPTAKPARSDSGGLVADEVSASDTWTATDGDADGEVKLSEEGEEGMFPSTGAGP